MIEQDRKALLAAQVERDRQEARVHPRLPGAHDDPPDREVRAEDVGQHQAQKPQGCPGSADAGLLGPQGRHRP